jgi:hypothetical protein
MSNTDQGGSMEGPNSQAAPVSDPAAAGKVGFFGVCFLLLALLIFYLLVTTWPVVLMPDPAVPANAGANANKVLAFKPFRFFGLGPYNWAPDLRMFLTVIIAGTIGSLIHTLTSFGDYVGNRRLSSSWLWWFVLRTPIGISLAIVSYLILRGGLIAPTLQASRDGDLQGATVLLNPYGIAAFAALAGMFSRQATDKLREVFETVFTAQKAVPRAEPLKGRPALELDPARLTRGKPQLLTVAGTGFDKNIKATVDSKSRAVQWISETQIKITILDEDVAKAGRLDLTLKNPNNETFNTTVEVVEPSAAAKPVISSTDPAELSKDSPKALTVIGQSFQNGCTATINGDTRAVVFGGDSRITVTLTDQDLAQPGVLKLAVRNPGADGQASDVHDIAVK